MKPNIRHSCQLVASALPFLALLVAPLAAQEKGDWPRFRGPTGQGVSTDTGLPTTWGDKENLVWKIDLPGPGTSSPIIVGSRIFLTCYTGYNVPGKPAGDMAQLKLHLVCLARDSGKVLWTSDIAAKTPEQAKMREGHGYASSTPVADAERVYCFFGKSGAVAFDHDGKQLWHADVGSKIDGFGSGASPILSGDHLIVNASVESESLFALDKKTGKEVWRTRGIREAFNTPILTPTPAGKTELLIAIHGKVLGLNPATGEQIWSCATDIPWYMVPSFVTHEDVVYVLGGRPGYGLAVRLGGEGNVTATHRPWKITKGSNVTSPIYHEGHLYWMHDNLSVAYCAEAKTGKIVYEERIPRANQVYACPVLVDGKIYYVSRTGTTYVVAAKTTFELVATNNLSDRSTFNASPAVAGGRLYLRSDRSLYCIGKK